MLRNLSTYRYSKSGTTCFKTVKAANEWKNEQEVKENFNEISLSFDELSLL